MLSSALALFALLPFIAASPIEKRYSGVTIQSGRTGTCLTLTGAPSNGAPLFVGDCSTATKWDINPGSGSVVVTGTNFALDAGSNPSNNVPAKVWTSYPGLTQQTWFLTGDNRIAITGGNQCLDEGDNGPQTYQCTTGNTNQVWYVGGNGGGSGPSASASMSMMPSASASASSTTSAAPSPSASTPSGGSHQIKWIVDPGQCLTAAVGAYNGAPITLQSCVTNSPNEASQLFVTNQGGNFELAGTGFCLDAGSNPSNGGDLKLWQCYPGLGQQTYSAITNRRIQTINNQCIDVDNSNNERMQTWTCSDSDRQQMFVY